jgi:hypothetical protein
MSTPTDRGQALSTNLCVGAWLVIGSGGVVVSGALVLRHWGADVPEITFALLVATIGFSLALLGLALLFFGRLIHHVATSGVLDAAAVSIDPRVGAGYYVRHGLALCGEGAVGGLVGRWLFKQGNDLALESPEPLLYAAQLLVQCMVMYSASVAVALIVIGLASFRGSRSVRRAAPHSPSVKLF